MTYTVNKGFQFVFKATQDSNIVFTWTFDDEIMPYSV